MWERENYRIEKIIKEIFQKHLEKEMMLNT